MNVEIPDITIIVPFRNREIIRVQNLCESISATTKKTNYRVIVSDYGSKPEISEQLESVANQFGFIHVYTESRGLPWCKSHAINVAVKNCSSEYIAIIDVDMVLHDSILDSIDFGAASETVFLAETFWPQARFQHPLKGRVFRSPGAFMVLNRKWFDVLKGFDERIVFWGSEDTDWLRRLRLHGAQIEWLLHSKFRISHSWHTRQNNVVNRPATAEWTSMQFEMQNYSSSWTTGAWGKPIDVNDRPVLACLGSETQWVDVDARATALVDTFGDLYNALQRSGNVRLLLGDRVLKRKLSRFSGISFFINILIEPFSLKSEPEIWRNFEAFLVAKKVLKNAIRDYYIEDDFSTVYLVGNGHETT